MGRSHDGGNAGVLRDRGNSDRREQNVIQYWTPSIGGFAFRASATANKGKTATLNPRVYSGSVTFTRGPICVFYGYEEHQDVSAALKEKKGNSVGGYFNAGPVKLGAFYEVIEVVRRFAAGSEPIGVALMLTAFVNAATNWLNLRLLRPHRKHGVHRKASWIFTANDMIANQQNCRVGAVRDDLWFLASGFVYRLGSGDHRRARRPAGLSEARKARDASQK